MHIAMYTYSSALSYVESNRDMQMMVASRWGCQAVSPTLWSHLGPTQLHLIKAIPTQLEAFEAEFSVHRLIAFSFICAGLRVCCTLSKLYVQLI
jgi:hypothetical protein